MVSNSELRARARRQLDGNIFGANWLLGVLVVLIVSAITSLAGLTVVGAVIVLGPLAVGANTVFLSLARGREKADLMDVFNGFRQTDALANRILTGFLVCVFTFLWSLLFVIPGIVKAYSYSMATYISTDHPDWGWKKCIEASKTVMQGKKGKLFCLDLSFIGWYFVGALCLGVGTLFVYPYHYMARTNFYLDLKGDEPVAAEAEATES